jgi:hypothetical protein
MWLAIHPKNDMSGYWALIQTGEIGANCTIQNRQVGPHHISILELALAIGPPANCFYKISKTKDGYEENIHLVFKRFAFIGERRVVASPTDRQY